jgi:hypothetical protein
VRIGRREVQLTNLDKVYFPEPGLTKGDLVGYYLDVADCLLPHVRRRPMQMLRYPDGVDGFSFYQKRVPKPHPDWLETVHILFPGSGRTADFRSSRKRRASRGSSTLAASTSTRGTAASTMSRSPTTGLSTSIPARGTHGRAFGRSRWSSRR